MICDSCGGEINLSVGRCVVCGKQIDETSGIRLVHGLESMAEQYGILDDDTDDDIPDLLATGTYKRERKQYDGVKVERQYNGPSLGLDTYMELLGDDESSEQQTDINLQPIEYEPPAGDLSSDEMEDGGESIIGRMVEKTNSTFISKTYETTHKVLSPPIEKVLELYHESFPQMNRVKKNRSREKLAVFGIFIVIVIAVIGLIAFISSNIAPSVKGEWIAGETSTGEQLTIEFASGGEVIVRTYTDGEAHIYQRGTYEKHRRNDNNMLLISYEDGTTTRLYYDIHRNVGVFTNVDSSQTAQYIRIKK